MSRKRIDACPELRASRRITRRAALEAGWLGSLALGMEGLWTGRASASVNASPGFGSAKRCLLMFMWGGPSHLDTWDPKPEAPEEIRGAFQTIETAVPGIRVSEHFPMLARWTDQLAILRSLTHEDPAHLSSAHHILTGSYAPKRFSDNDPPSSVDWPHIGSVVAKLRPAEGSIPSFVTMPWTVMHPAAPGGKAPGQHAGWLGARFDPMGIGDPNDPGFRPPGLTLPADVDPGRLQRRRSLLDRMDQALLETTSAQPLQTSEDLSRRAFDLLAAPKVREAFSIAKEPDSVRDRFGRNTHGQSLLLARRLLEAGVPLVTVNWHNDPNPFWDTHHNNFHKLKTDLMPKADQGFSALLEDLQSRGLLDETLLVWVGEFGRQPRVSSNVAGREHWPFCFSGVLAGGGVRGGQTLGSSDKIGAYPAETPVRPDDLAATMFHALGISPETQIHDRQQVPRNVSHGSPLLSLFG